MFRDTSATDRALPVSTRLVSRKGLLIGLAGVGVLVGGALLLGPTLTAESTVPRERVRITEVKRGTLVRDVSSQGRVVAARSPFTPMRSGMT